ncbi:MAG TPA: hypothetical protein DCP53_01290 [Elusimicrobia bacterium]|nr:MAG: hypothetical protein A2551_07770 [Elusimicrobia bacterium RIFOXYD2_FULL_34_30]HAM38025.1 hypothetical protein [Elusimicrobiota bacterium]
MRYKVLVIDDHKGTLEALKMLFSYENYSVITAENGKTGINLAIQKQPDLIILDLVLPDIHGYKVKEVLENGKTTSHIPIMLFTGAMTTPKDEVYGFKMGACEYITKPFDPGVLVARVKNIFREREKKGGLKEVIKKYGLEIFEDERYIKVKSKEIRLTRKEFDLFFVLFKSQGRLLSNQYLLETVWDYEKDIDTHTLRSHIFSIKKKLGPEYAKKIINVKGSGYRLEIK